MKFRKRPVEIDAFQWMGDFDALDVWLNKLGYSEDGDSLDGGADGIHESETEDNILVIPTEEGEHRAQEGDWIIRGVRGEFYPCKPDIFEMTYEPATADDAVDCVPAPQTAEDFDFIELDATLRVPARRDGEAGFVIDSRWHDKASGEPGRLVRIVHVSDDGRVSYRNLASGRLTVVREAQFLRMFESSVLPARREEP